GAVARAAALITAASGGAWNGVVVNRLAESADAAGTAAQTGNGRLNLDRAINDASSASIEPAGAPPTGNGGPFIGPYSATATNSASTPATFQSDCTTSQTTFATGSTVCATSSVVTTGPTSSFSWKWIPGTSTTGTPSGDHPVPGLAAGTHAETESFTIAAAGPTGTWTVVVCKQNAAGACSSGNVLASKTFTVVGTNTITFNESGIPTTDAGATSVLSVTVGAGSPTAYNASQFPVVVTVATGTQVSYVYSSPVGSSTTGQRYALSSGPTPASPVTVNANTNVTAGYTAQWDVSFTSSGIGGDGSGTVVTVNSTGHPKSDLPFDVWVTDGGQVSYSFSDPVASTVTGR